MEEIEILSNNIFELGELINNSIYHRQGVWNEKNTGNWSKLWSSFDNIKDSLEVIKEYLNLKSGGYLAIYGVLQALIVQQDALQHIEESLGLLTKKFFLDYPDLYNIRFVRSEIVGHPTQTMIKGRGSSYNEGTVTYTSISPGTGLRIVNYSVWSKNGYSSKSVNILDIINKQAELLNGEIKGIMNKIKDNEEKHMKKFKKESLSDLLRTTGYLIQKLWPYERDRYYSKVCFESLTMIYKKYKLDIKNRYKLKKIDNNALSIPGVVMVVQKIDRLIPRIEKMIMFGQNVDELDLDVYVESLSHAFEDLRKMAVEIDEEFKK